MLRLDGSVIPRSEVVGGKAASVALMRSLGLPVPPAFVLETTLCREVIEDGEAALDRAWPQVEDGIVWLERETCRGLGSTDRPLLVSVRSGAARSMPGMMDTILNLGLTDAVTGALARAHGVAFVSDTEDRFQEAWSRLVGGRPPADPRAQLRAAILAVFRSWTSPRAISYRAHNKISEDLGTAVTVQAMVFGNKNERSGTGVLFTRNPLTGDDEIYGEWLSGGQGEDVVSGRFDPAPIFELASQLPDVHQRLIAHAKELELARRDMQDIEFTVEDGRLWILQSRAAKRSPHAAVRVAVAFGREGIVTPADALHLVNADQIRRASAPSVDPAARRMLTPLATGVPACPGVATGVAVSDPDEAERRADDGENVVLVRRETSPDDVHGMIAAVAVVTETGGATSHAAVVCRELGRPGIVGCGAGIIEQVDSTTVTVDGTNGELFLGEVACLTGTSASAAELAQLAAWSNERDVPSDLLAALSPHR